MRKKYSRPDPKLSAEIGRASADGQKQRGESKKQLAGLQGRLAAAEQGTGIDLSRTLTRLGISEQTISDMWAKAAGVPAMEEICRLLSALSAKATERNRRLYETAESFYRGTSLYEAADVGRRGGGISQDGDFNYTSLTADLGISALYGWWNDIHAVLEWTATLRKTGSAVPVEYSYKSNELNQAVGRPMPLFHRTEAEIRIPDLTKGPVLKNVFLSPNRTLTDGDFPKIKGIGGAGADVRTFYV